MASSVHLSAAFNPNATENAVRQALLGASQWALDDANDLCAPDLHDFIAYGLAGPAQHQGVRFTAQQLRLVSPTLPKILAHYIESDFSLGSSKLSARIQHQLDYWDEPPFEMPFHPSFNEGGFANAQHRVLLNHIFSFGLQAHSTDEHLVFIGNRYLMGQLADGTDYVADLMVSPVDIPTSYFDTHYLGWQQRLLLVDLFDLSADQKIRHVLCNPASQLEITPAPIDIAP